MVTTYTVFTGANTPARFGSGDLGPFSLGLEVEVDEPCALNQIRFYSGPEAGSLPTACAIYDIDTQQVVPGTLNTSPSWVGALGSGVVYVAYDGSVTLEPGAHYAVTVFGTGTGSTFFYNAGSFWSTGGGAAGLTNGPLSAPSSASSVHGQALYNSGSPIAFPGSTVVGYDFAVDLMVTPGGTGPSNPSVTTTSLPGGRRGVAYSQTLAATGGTTPHVWSVSSGSLPPGLSLVAGTGVVSGTPATSGTYDFTATVTDSASRTGSVNLSITISAATGGVSVVLASTSGGVATYTVTSALNTTGGAGPQPMRVLAPSNPAAGVPHNFLWLLPVEPGQGTSFGDSIATIQALDAHNQYNLTCIQPGFPIDPWYADNDTDQTTQQETFMLDLVTWASGNLAASGTEDHYLIGFSKSGVGGQQLFLRNPSVFAAVASWDFPADASAYNQYDGSPVYGNQQNFEHYELSSVNLTAWKPNLGTTNRIVIGAGISFDTDVSDYDALLTSLGIPHSYSFVAASEHNWSPTPGWVGPALEVLFPAPTTPASVRRAAVPWWVNTVSVETYTGAGAYGPRYAAPVTIASFIDDSAKWVRHPAGDEVVSVTTIYAPLDAAAVLAVESRVTVNGRVARVVAVNSLDGDAFGLPSHVVATLT